MAAAIDVPDVPAWLQNGFHRFLRPYLRRHFHAVAIEHASRPDKPPAADEPLIVYANHPSWWDPLIAHFLNRNLFPERQFYAPIDAEALEQYRVFGKLGFFGVRMNSKSGAADFLKQSSAILDSGGALWVTPEGRFADVRDHTAELMPGIAHLCTRMTRGLALPLALEYAFWDERLPVCLVKLGEPLSMETQQSKASWTLQLTRQLREAQQTLSTLTIARRSDGFDNLLSGKVGAGMVYDTLRRIKAFAVGRPFRPQHGEQFE